MNKTCSDHEGLLGCNLLQLHTRLEEAECLNELISVYERNDQDFEGDP